MNNKKPFSQMLPLAVAISLSSQAQAAITLYEQDDTSFSTDGMINTFLVSTEEKTATETKNQSRVMMGFLPNWIGFNFAKQVDDLKVGARSSFWVTINDSDPIRTQNSTHGFTDTGIDVRQFYGTVASDWGEVLIGKDFGLFNRSNILGDEILLGYGQTHTVTSDAANVSFGNIGTGYLYPFPVSQITYRSPDMGGFQVAAGVFDPNKSSTTSEESAPRIEAEATYNGEFDQGSYKVWLGGMTQSSKEVSGGGKVDSNGVSYGANVKFGGLSLSASGFDATGVGAAGLGNTVTSDDADVDGHLLQASYSFGKERLVLSYGKNKGGTTPGGSELDLKNHAVAWFHKVNDNFQLVAEYDKAESDSKEVRSITIGAVLSY
ncbi:porin [Motiliproteus sp.]|uniref:porin n=1 Tax=Motiliproteus sp. TaxID=1898955 RepID=UPI003BADB342